jgi:nucleotide-binding universal stress UspA family protein
MTYARSPSHLLCIVDGTPAADAALASAIELASKAGARLSVAVCAPSQRQAGCSRFPASKWEELMRERCAADLERAAELIARVGAGATLVVLDGCEAREIARAADARGCDAIVVATRHGRLSSFGRALRRHGRAEVVTIKPLRGRPDVSSPAPVPEDRAFRP